MKLARTFLLLLLLRYSILGGALLIRTTGEGRYDYYWTVC